ncbi:uncharacterized protein LOC120325966 [Styela clava]
MLLCELFISRSCDKFCHRTYKVRKMLRFLLGCVFILILIQSLGVLNREQSIEESPNYDTFVVELTQDISNLFDGMKFIKSRNRNSLEDETSSSYISLKVTKYKPKKFERS